MSRITVERRLEIEDAVIVHAMNECMKAGWDLHGVDDGGEFFHTGSMLEALEITRSVDDCHVYFIRRHSNGTSSKVSMYLVRGNDGPDVIADHSVALGFENVMDQVYEWTDKFNAEVYGV
jgi:hypothetical protein